MKLFVEKRTMFPDPEAALGPEEMDEGVIDLSDDLRVERLLEAYSFGIFPWPHEELPTLWFCPPRRGVLDFGDFHIPKSFEKQMKKLNFRGTFNNRFDDVIEACASAPRLNQVGTWITPKMVRAYKNFHRAGYAHSVECWEEDRLVGGLYGVYVGGVFSGESMFHVVSGASKFALVHTVQFLMSKELRWMDIQMVTPLLEGFGGKYIPRSEFLGRVREAHKTAKPLF